MIKIERDYPITYCNECKLYKLELPFNTYGGTTEACCYPETEKIITVYYLSELLEKCFGESDK